MLEGELPLSHSPSAPRHLAVAWLGTVPYADALDLQRSVARARLAGTLLDDALLLLEHPPVVTTGRSTAASNLLLDETALAARGIELFDVERGGDVTFHGPGQLVGYPIIDLKGHRQDLHWYLRLVEQILIDTVAGFGLTGSRVAGRTGVWVDDRKIASIGVHARQWVTWHGFALNVTTDLSYFDVMVPCGIPDVQMTSVANELGRTGAPVTGNLMDDVRERLASCAAAALGLSPRAIDAATLREIVVEPAQP